jgi:hypothetical protein
MALIHLFMHPVRCFISEIFFLHDYSPLLDVGRFFSFLILYTVGTSPWTWDQPVARPHPPHRTTQTQIKHTQTSMPRAGFGPTIPVFERAKAVYALDRSATVIGHLRNHICNYMEEIQCRRSTLKVVGLCLEYNLLYTTSYSKFYVLSY